MAQRDDDDWVAPSARSAMRNHLARLADRPHEVVDEQPYLRDDRSSDVYEVQPDDEHVSPWVQRAIRGELPYRIDWHRAPKEKE